MKQLLNGVAIVAVFAIATPVWAQPANAPMTPSSPPKAAPAPKTMAAPAAGMATTMPKKPMRKMVAHHRHMRMGAADTATEELNRQELARISGGGAPPPMPPGGPAGGNAPTSGASGPFAPAPGMAAPPPPAK